MELEVVKFPELDDNAGILHSSNCLSVLDPPQVVLYDIKPFLKGRTKVKTSECLEYIENEKKITKQQQTSFKPCNSSSSSNDLNDTDKQKTITTLSTTTTTTTKNDNVSSDNNGKSKDKIEKTKATRQLIAKRTSIVEPKFLRSVKNNSNNKINNCESKTEKVVVKVDDQNDQIEITNNNIDPPTTHTNKKTNNKRKHPFNDQVNTATITTTTIPPPTTTTKNKKRKTIVVVELEEEEKEEEKKPEQENMEPVKPDVLDEKDVKSSENIPDDDVTNNNNENIPDDVTNNNENIPDDVTNNNNDNIPDDVTDNDTQVPPPSDPILCLVEKQLETGTYYLTSQEGNRLQLMCFNGHTLEFITPQLPPSL